MAAVSPKVLKWLYENLKGYQDPNRTYSDVAQALSQYPTLSPRTDVYTYENGRPALLLHLSGTLPVTFRNVVYRFPISVWIPQSYPREAPMAFVTPTQDMLVRPGQHVSGEGRIYHHYLAHWADAWDHSNVVDFFSILRDVFAKEPPVISKQQQQMGRPPPTQQDAAPPPVPPLPPELTKSPSPVPQREPSVRGPPPPPPKPPQSYPQASPPEGLQNRPYDRPHLLPPIPGKPPRPYDQQSSQLQNGYPQSSRQPQQFQPQRSSSLRQYAGGPPQQSSQNPPYHQYAGRPDASPVSPIASPQHPFRQHQQSPTMQPQYGQQGPPLPPIPGQGGQPPPPTQQFQHPPHPTQGQYPSQYPPQPFSPQAQPKPKQPVADLLSSPLDLPLPSSTNHIAPPIPPNPEKDALLSTLSRELTTNLHHTIQQHQSYLPALQSQHSALSSALSTVQSEISNLQTLSANLASNQKILQSSIASADRVIADAQARKAKGDLPEVDEILVAPTVVGKQLYELVAEERGIGDAIWALQRALENGRISTATWVKLTRGLARERFVKAALIRKIGRGMGLEGA